MTLPLPWSTNGPVGSQWDQQFSFPSIDISTYTWEFVLRTSTQQTGTPAVKVTETAGASGYITADPVARTVMVVLSPTATATLNAGATYALALWSDVDLPDEKTWVRGTFTALPVAAP